MTSKGQSDRCRGKREKSEGAPTGGPGKRLTTSREPVKRPPVSSERREALHRFLVEEIHPLVPEELRGKGVSKAERERILGSLG
jgi:hypothetical protein